MNDTDKDPNQKKVMRMYSAFGAGLVLSFWPSGIAALISLVLVLGVMTVAYMWRSDAEDGSLMENHMTFIIRTIWIGGFLALVTLVIAAAYLFRMLDNTPLNPCLNDLMNFMSSGDMLNIEPLVQSMQDRCMIPYLARNLNTLITGGIIGIAPVVIYFFVRFSRGFGRARGGYRIASPKAWF
jgi:uncharacterized membrane protein